MAAQMKEFLGTSYLFGGNAPFIEELYEKYLETPDAVEPEWRRWAKFLVDGIASPAS